MSYDVCNTCQFFVDPGNGGAEECRRHPPQIIVVQDSQFRQRVNRCMWTHVSPTTGCGEHRAAGSGLEAQDVNILALPNVTIAAVPDLTIVSIPSLTIGASPVVGFGSNSLDINILSGGL